MFNRRRRNEEPPTRPPEGPDVYVTSGPAIPGGMHRFFFSETLSEEGAAAVLPSLEQQLMFLSDFSFEPRNNYVTVTWSPKTEDARALDEVGADVQLIVIGALAHHFGWRNPDIATFTSDEERHSLMKERGVNWVTSER